MKPLLLVLSFVVSFVHGGFAYAEQCQPGYFLDEENVCQICPAGYWCPGDGEQHYCHGFSNVTGVADYDDCGVQGIPPGKELYYDGDDFYEYSDCYAGYYCPGSDEFYDGGSNWGETFGRIECPSRVGPSGAVSVEQCCAAGMAVQDNQCVMPESCEFGYFLDADTGLCIVCPVGYYCDGVGVPMACPEMPELPDDKWWGYYAINAVSEGLTGTVTDCGGAYVYGNLPSYQRIVEMFNSGDMALIETDVMMSVLCMMWGSVIEPYENPKYSATSPINSAGAGVVMLTYDETAKKYIISVLATECHAGYWAEYGIMSNLSDNVFVVETPQQISDYLCKPVGTGYWGAGSVFDMDAGEVVGGTERNACPVGTGSDGYGAGADSVDDCRLLCADGYAEYNGECARLCMVGIRYLKTGNGLSFPLWGDRHAQPSLVVAYNGGQCYGSLQPGQEKNTINIQYEDQIYHLMD